MTNEEFWEWMNTCPSGYAITDHNVDNVTIIFPLFSGNDGEVDDEV